MKIIKNAIYRLRGEVSTDELIKRGLQVGTGFERLNQVIIDDSHPWLIEIGDNVTLAPRVHILAHDASTKRYLGYTKIGRVIIGDRVFIGAGTIIMPNTKIGNDVIIGANSVVTHDLPDGVVAAGNPAKIICGIKDYLIKEKKRMKDVPIYGKAFTIHGKITTDMKLRQKKEIVNCGGFVE